MDAWASRLRPMIVGPVVLVAALAPVGAAPLAVAEIVSTPLPWECGSETEVSGILTTCPTWSGTDPTNETSLRSGPTCMEGPLWSRKASVGPDPVRCLDAGFAADVDLDDPSLDGEASVWVDDSKPSPAQAEVSAMEPSLEAGTMVGVQGNSSESVEARAGVNGWAADPDDEIEDAGGRVLFLESDMHGPTRVQTNVSASTEELGGGAGTERVEENEETASAPVLTIAPQPTMASQAVQIQPHVPADEPTAPLDIVSAAESRDAPQPALDTPFEADPIANPADMKENLLLSDNLHVARPDQVMAAVGLTVSVASMAFVLRWALSLFSRLHKDALLDSKSREALVEAVQARPWATMRDLQAATGLSRSTIRYHLKVLGSHGLVSAVRIGNPLQFAGGPAPGAPEPDPVRQLLQEEVRERAKPLAAIIGRLVQTLGYSRSGAWRALRSAIQRAHIPVQRVGRRVLVGPTGENARPAS